MEYLAHTGQIEASCELLEVQEVPLPETPADETPSSPSRFKLIRADQIEIRSSDWLLRGMLERDTLALVFGEPGCGKSFLVIDWMCRIATGTPWRGHGIQAAPVVYIAGEGPTDSVAASIPGRNTTA